MTGALAGGPAGGSGTVLTELEALARPALPVTAVVFDDATPSLIRLEQQEPQGGPVR